MNEIFDNLISTMTEIIQNENLKNDFKKNKTLEEMFSFCKEYGFKGNFHEFEIEIIRLLAYSMKKTDRNAKLNK